MFKRFEKRFGRSAQCRSLAKLYYTIRHRKKAIVWDGNNTPLHLAILSFEGDVSPVKILLEHDESGINVRNSEGETPLHLAVQNDSCSPELIELLLKHGADAKATTPRDGNTALHWLALGCNKSKKVEYAVSVAAAILLEYGSDANARNLEGCIPLHYAAQSNMRYQPLTGVLLQNGSDVCMRNFKGDTPLHFCLKNKSSRFYYVKWFLKKTRDVNVANFEGETPLYFAVQNEECSAELIELLLEHGADVHVKSSRDGNTALHLLAMGFVDCEASYYALCKIFLDRGSDSNARNLEGCTPLHYAAQSKRYGYPPVIGSLLEHGSDVCMRNSKGDTPLHLLLKNKLSRFFNIRLFLKKFPDVTNVVNSEGESPLHVLVRNKRRSLLLTGIIVLLSHGADVRIKDALGENAHQAYCRAVEEDNRKADPTIRMLLQGKKCMNSSLRVACLYHDVDSVHRLLKLGADDVNAVDTFDYQPLFYAVFAYGDDVEKRSTILRLLFDFGADVNHLMDFNDVMLGRINGNDNYLRPITSFLKADHVNGLFRFFYQPSRPNDCPVMLDIFYQQLAKLSALQEKQIERGMDHLVEVTKMTRDLHNGDYLTLLQQDDTRTRLEEYHNDCLSRCSEEVKSMSETEWKIGRSRVSFLDLLLADAIEPAIINTRNKELVKAFHAKTAAFPLYQGMLDAKIDKAIERQKLIESAAVSMSDALEFADPSDEFYERTLSYCSNKDLINLIDGLDETKRGESVSIILS